MEEKVLKQHGGKREGAGRKKTVPEGARTRAFILTDDEVKAVKGFIVSMRKEQAKEAKGATQKQGMDVDDLVQLGYKILKPIAELVIQSKGRTREAERIMKAMAIMAFKDVVCELEQREQR